MTTFSAVATSVEGSRPVRLYQITYGGTSLFYTSSEDEIVRGGNTYRPEAITSGRIVLGIDERRRVLELRVPSTNEFVIRYVNVAPGTVAVCTISEIERGDSFLTVRRLYSGKVSGVRFSDNGQTAFIGVRSRESVLTRQMPRYTFQAQCNTIVYGPDCQATPITFTGPCSAVSGINIVVDGASSRPDGFWAGSVAKPVGSNDPRMIVKHVGDTLTLILPFATSPLHQQVDLFAGCDRHIDGDCLNRHHNVPRHHGHPFVPTKNPFATGLD